MAAHVNQAQIAKTGNPRLGGWMEGAFSLRGAVVVLRTADGARIVAQTPMDSHGWFHFADPAPGTYRLDVSWKGKTYRGADQLILLPGFDVEVYTGWGEGYCIPAR